MKKLVHNVATSIRIFYLRVPVLFGIITVTMMLVAGVAPVMAVPGWIAFLLVISMLVQDLIRDVFGPTKRPLEFWR